jgi:signal transduction histidine kinase
MATVIVMAGYLVAVVVLNVFVVHRLTSQADSHLTDRLKDAQRDILSVPKSGAPTVHRDRDVDDAPAFVWLVSPAGAVTTLTAGAPSLPHRQWSGGPVTLPAGGTSFRFETVKTASGWLVAGESIGQIQRVQSTLLLFETILGAAVLVVVFGGSLVIGLRASAPLELVRQRQAEFTADASHELRTPLSVIEAEVDLALSRPRTADAYRDVLHRVAGEGQRLRSIVDDLLWLARVDHEHPRVADGDGVDVAGTAETCVDRFQAVAAARAVTLRFHHEGKDPALLHASPAWIDRLIGVLVDNACRYAGRGGVVEVGVRTSGARIVLDVDDSGPGIGPEDRELVFDRFHRGVDTPGGTGLGLAIADSVVRATEGTWSIRTAPLGGARMEVSWRKGAGQRGSGPRPRRYLRGRRPPTEAAPTEAADQPAEQHPVAPT